MQNLLQFLESMPSSYRSLALIGGLVVFWVLEGTVPLFAMQYRRVRHATLNIVLTLFQIVLAFVFGAVIVYASEFTTNHRWGLLYLIDLPLWLRVGLGVLLLDCIGGYWIHRIEHQISWLWRFHIVLHTDKHLDVTTGLRHHPAETIFRLSAQLAAVLVGGVPVGVLFLYQLLAVLFAQWTHANIRLFPTADRVLSYVLVTPGMHKVHHHHQKPLTDTNYGNIFSVWDRLFGTFAEVDPNTLEYGIDSLECPEDHDKLGRLLRIPFESRKRVVEE